MQRRIDGDHNLRLNIAEKREAIRILHARGYSDVQIGQALGHHTKAIHRIRHQELKLPANFDRTGRPVNQL